MNTALLLLADSRLPAGGHAHSGGIEQAVLRGDVTDLDTLEAFLRGRLVTAGGQAAAVSALACTRAVAASSTWSELDDEVSARMPSPAARAASRAQGRALLRVVAAMWPAAAVPQLGERPHHAVVLGVATAMAGGGPRDAARIVAAHAVTAPASAALRLLGLDPVALTGLLARLAPDVDDVAERATSASVPAGADPRLLPSWSAPLLDVLAERHTTAEVKLFAS